MVNYIYASIEAIVYYPFFVIYTSFYFQQTFGEIPYIGYLIVMASIFLAEFIFFSITIYLVWYGCKKRGFHKESKNIWYLLNFFNYSLNRYQYITSSII